MHSGSNNTFRIIGSVDAGEKITYLQANKSTGYTQIQDNRGRKGWVESKFVSTKERYELCVCLSLRKNWQKWKTKLANAVKRLTVKSRPSKFSRFS